MFEGAEYAAVGNHEVDEGLPDFGAFLEQIGEAGLQETITPKTPIVYCSMEFYDKEDNDIKGGGGLGILAADTRRVAERLGIPLVVMTPFYPIESHQHLTGFNSTERHEYSPVDRLYKKLGEVAISTYHHPVVRLDKYDRQLGSTRILTVTERGFDELYPGGNSDDHRLYQEVALGFGGYKALREAGLRPSFMQLNEAPTVFAAIAMLDDLCGEGVPFEDAFDEVRQKILYTNHTLVQAVEAEFEQYQFEQMVMPNIVHEEVKEWVRGMLLQGSGSLKLSSLAVELSGMKNGVSELHACVSDFKDRHGNQVEFEAVTNGISDKWILPEIAALYRESGILDRFDLPTADYRDRLDNLDQTVINGMKKLGRQHMKEVLSNRRNQYGETIDVPEDAIVFDFKRRFVGYKRPGMAFHDLARLADILQKANGYLLLTGKPHPNDRNMKDELRHLLETVDSNPILKERVHYIQDYDEEVGRALAIGADCAVNVPVVGLEACGTSWMKDIANFKLLISTPDGGVADRSPDTYLEVSGDETEALYARMTEAVVVIRDQERNKEVVAKQLKEYMPIISGSRMMKSYLGLYARSAAAASIKQAA